MAPAQHTDLLPLAVCGELLRGNKDTELEDGFQLGGKPLGLKVLELSLSRPSDGHIQAQAEHAGETGCSVTARSKCWQKSRVGNAGSRETSTSYTGLCGHWLLKSCPFT